MALEVFEAISHGKVTVSHNVHHDLESLLWVIIYTIYKHCVNVDSNNEELKKDFKTFFGATSMEKIVIVHYHAISHGHQYFVNVFRAKARSACSLCCLHPLICF